MKDKEGIHPPMPKFVDSAGDERMYWKKLPGYTGLPQNKSRTLYMQK